MKGINENGLEDGKEEPWKYIQVNDRKTKED
jgi:hypothetical protein